MNFQEVLEDICTECCDFIIVEDFNVDWMKDFYKAKLKSIISDNCLKQKMSDCIRITNNSKTLIYYVITNNDNILAQHK